MMIEQMGISPIQNEEEAFETNHFTILSNF